MRRGAHLHAVPSPARTIENGKVRRVHTASTRIIATPAVRKSGEPQNSTANGPKGRAKSVKPNVDRVSDRDRRLMAAAR